MAAKSTFGLRPKRLAELLDAGSGDEPVCSRLAAPQAAEQLMRRRMANPLNLYNDRVDSPSAILSRPCPELQTIEGRPLGEVLLDPTTSLAILETLKRYGKDLASRWGEGPEHVVAVTIYFGAIAAALSSHSTKITARSYRELADSLRILMDDRWITPELAGLFDTVRTICEAEGR